MTRLRIELERLYGLPLAEATASASAADRRQDVRAAVLAVVLPAGWGQLSTVWRGVQADLELPAPAIAVSGLDALQLWFSFATPLPPVTALRFLRALRERYLPDTKAAQWRMAADAASLPTPPSVETGPQRWSAFVTHDLAAVFEETPWLDLPPTDEGQATILRALEPMRPAAFEAALELLGAVDDGEASTRLAKTAGEPAAGTGLAATQGDPARFLAGVMNDAGAPLALRIEAARILLADRRRP